MKQKNGWIVTNIGTVYFLAILLLLPQYWRYVLKYSGYAASISLAVALSLTPLRILFPTKATIWLNKLRREIGVSACTYALIHFLSIAVKKGTLSILTYYFWYKFTMPVRRGPKKEDHRDRIKVLVKR